MQHNERGQEMMNWLPWYYADSRIMNEIIHAQSKEIVFIRNKILYLLEQLYVDTADEFGIYLWEKELGITPTEGASLDLRKAVVKAKLRRPPIMTPKQIDSIINLFFEQGTAHAHHIEGTYHLDIEIPWEENLKWAEAMREALERAKPAHLGYTLSYRAYLEEELDTTDASEGDFFTGIRLGWYDAIPYGTNIPILGRDGIQRHGKKFARNGGFVRGGRGYHGLHTFSGLRHYGGDDLTTDRVIYGVGLSFTDSVKETTEEGAESLSLAVQADHVPPSEDRETAVEALYYLRHNGEIRHDGKYARGVPLKATGDFELIREGRNGKFVRGGGMTHRSNSIPFAAFHAGGETA